MRGVVVVTIRFRASVTVLLAFLVTVGCARVPKRTPLPAALSAAAAIPGSPGTRFWGDAAPPEARQWFRMTPEEIAEHYSGIVGRPHAYLAISGGGGDGAFGAGLLNGWSESGSRPEFTIVTGISTGALIAPFAFLGSDYDDKLKVLYTTTSTKDVLKMRGAFAPFIRDAVASSKPLQDLLERYITEDVREAIAAEHRKGRRLLIGTTNLDAGRPVIWDLGAIASSGDAESLKLMRTVLLASASIPAAFPPVLMQVTANGRTYDELHVDGGVTSQVFLFPVSLDWRRTKEALEVKGTPAVYVIRNAQLDPRWMTVKNRFVPIALRSASSLVRTQGVGDLYRIYLQTQRQGLAFHLAFIPDTFNRVAEEEFDTGYMKELFDLGFKMAMSTNVWKSAPPKLLTN